MKKVLSIVLSIAMVLCMMPAMAFAGTVTVSSSAAYSDIEGTSCEGAVNVLSALGVVDGYTDGTYKPEQTVTRAEMAKLVVTALGVADYAQATTSKYTDMGAASWAIPYVEYASNLNIVNGVGNNRFDPNATVTYEQAATMIVRALGYTDECKEMNGTWPAIYIQKAMALGIFEDIVNGGANGANRGDTAIMLFNAIDLPEVYADGDGATQYKNGSQSFVGSDGKNFKGTSMLATLNKDGSSKYKVIDETDADNAVYNVRNYVGLVGKVYENKDGDVISVGDLQSAPLTGSFNSDYDEFTVGDKTYKIANDALKNLKVSDDGATYSFVNATDEIPYFINGEKNDTGIKVSNLKDLGSDTNKIKYNKSYTLGVKTNGSTITQIHSIAVWDASKRITDLFEESDASVISNSHKLYGKEFDEDDNKDIDYSSFQLVGVESLDDIVEDNVVYVYYNGDTIRRVEVGTETVTGTFEEFSEGTLASGMNNGKPATVIIDGKSYKTSKAASTTDSNTDDIEPWTTADDDDSVSVGDEITAFLTASGSIYKVELSKASSSNYAMVLDYALAYGKDGTKPVIKNASSLTGDDSQIKIMTSAGEALTLKFKNNAELVDNSGKTLISEDMATGKVTTSAIEVGDIITYDLNSANNVKKITLKAEADLGSKKVDDITAKGYYGGTAIADNATIFTVDKTSNRKEDSNMIIPSVYIDDDDADVASLDSLKDTDDVTCYANFIKSGRYASMVIDGNSTTNNDIFGVITSYTKLGSDDPSGCDYKLNTIVNGESKVYYLDASLPGNIKNTFFRFKTNASGNVTDLYPASGSAASGATAGEIDVTNFKGYVLGCVTSHNNQITFKNNSVILDKDYLNASDESRSIDSDAVFYKYDDDDNAFEVCYKADIESADSGKIAVLIDTDTGSDKDKVADVVLLINKAQLEYNVPDSFIKDSTGTTDAEYSNLPKTSVEATAKEAVAAAKGSVTVKTAEVDKDSLEVTVKAAAEALVTKTDSVTVTSDIIAKSIDAPYEYTVKITITSSTVSSVSDTVVVTIKEKNE